MTTGGSSGGDASVVVFPPLDALKSWRDPLAAVTERTVRAAQESLAYLATRQSAQNDDCANDDADDMQPALSKYQRSVASQIVVARLKSDAARLATLVHIIDVAAPRPLALPLALPNGDSTPPPAARADTAAAPPTMRLPHLWCVVARHVKRRLARLLSFIQLDVACVHALLLPPTLTVDVPVSDAEGELTDEHLGKLSEVASAFDLHPSQMLRAAMDAWHLVRTTTETRLRLSLGDTPIDTTQVPATSSRLLSRDVAAINQAPDASLTEENTLYCVTLKRHQCETVLQLGDVVGRNELLAAAQVDAINGPLADVVVGTMHLYNALVATFTDYQREASTYHKVATARAALIALEKKHVGGPLLMAAHGLALGVGEVVKACDVAEETLNGAARWAAQVKVASSSSVVATRQTMRYAGMIAGDVGDLDGRLAEALETCRLALTEHCHPVIELLARTLDTQSGALLPLAQAVSAVMSEMRNVDVAVTRELAQLRGRVVSAAVGDAALREWLRDPEASMESDTQDPIKNPGAIDAAWCERRVTIATAIVQNAKHAVMQLPASLAALVRVVQAPAAFREGRAALTLRAAVLEEAELMDASLKDALASMRKYRAVLAAADSAVTGSSAAMRNQVTSASLATGIDTISREMAATPPDDGGRGSKSPRRRPGTLSSDETVAIGVLRDLVAQYSTVERELYELSKGEFAPEGDDRLVTMQLHFEGLVTTVECLGDALYLDSDALRRIGTPAIAAAAELREAAATGTSPVQRPL